MNTSVYREWLSHLGMGGGGDGHYRVKGRERSGGVNPEISPTQTLIVVKQQLIM